MSMALIIRNINPDCDPNAKLIVVTLDDNNPAISEMALTPYSPTINTINPDGQLYWFPRSTRIQDNLLLLNDADHLANHCSLQDDHSMSEPSDYLWFCELDQAG